MPNESFADMIQSGQKDEQKIQLFSSNFQILMRKNIQEWPKYNHSGQTFKSLRGCVIFKN